MKEFSTVEEAHTELAKGVADFVKQRSWDSAVCECNIFSKMASSKCWLMKNGVRDTSGIDWSNSSIDKGGAALFLRDHLLRTTGKRIWGLTFTLYPDGKFNIEYDYTKPEGYEETDNTVEVDLLGLQ